MQFSSATYTTSEAAGSAIITVARTGDISAPAAINYATSDGTASELSDYTTALGTLQFAAGETEKRFTVFIIDDARAEGSETVTLTLSAPSGASLGSQFSATLTINDNDSSTSPSNPIDDSSFFVRQHYLDFFGRDADAPGLAFWTGNINSCGADTACREVKRMDTSAAYFLSIEFQETGFLVYRAYRAAYGRRPGYWEFLFDLQRIGRGVVVGQTGWEQQLEQNKQAYFAEFAARAEYKSLYDGGNRFSDNGHSRDQHWPPERAGEPVRVGRAD